MPFVHSAIWNDAEFRTLHKDYKLIWLHLLTSDVTGRCGIFLQNEHIMAGFSGVSCRNTVKALSEFERLGWIKRDGNGFIWIVNYVAHQSKQQQWRERCARDARKLQAQTELAVSFFEHYPDLAHIVPDIGGDIDDDIKGDINPDINGEINPDINPKSAAKSGAKCGFIDINIDIDRDINIKKERRGTPSGDGSPSAGKPDAKPAKPPKRKSAEFKVPDPPSIDEVVAKFTDAQRQAWDELLIYYKQTRGGENPTVLQVTSLLDDVLYQFAQKRKQGWNEEQLASALDHARRSAGGKDVKYVIGILRNVTLEELQKQQQASNGGGEYPGIADPLMIKLPDLPDSLT